MEFFKYGRLPTPSNSSSYTTVLNTQDLEKKKNQTTIHTHTCTHPSYGHILLRVLNRNQKPEAFSLRQNNCTGWISSSVLILLAWWPSQCGGYNLETQSHWPEEAGTEFSTTATELRGWGVEAESLQVCTQTQSRSLVDPKRHMQCRSPQPQRACFSCCVQLSRLPVKLQNQSASEEHNDGP